MIIPLSRIGDEPFAWRENLSIPAKALKRQEVVRLSDIACHGRATVVSGRVLLEIGLSYEQTLACIRCLVPIVTPMEIKADLDIVVGSTQPAPGELELNASDLNTLYVEDENLDTRPIFLEQIQLNVPMRALCGKDCGGLCSVCGVNRNEEACDCESRAVDPRWEALRAWSEGH